MTHQTLMFMFKHAWCYSMYIYSFYNFVAAEVHVFWIWKASPFKTPCHGLLCFLILMYVEHHASAMLFKFTLNSSTVVVGALYVSLPKIVFLKLNQIIIQFVNTSIIFFSRLLQSNSTCYDELHPWCHQRLHVQSTIENIQWWKN